MNFDEDILQDFLVEAKEGINNLEEGFVELEKNRKNVEVLKSLFRTMHSLKGASGFFGFKTMESIAHFSEDILSKLRDGLIEPEEDVIDILLKAVDYIKYIIKFIEENKTEPIEDKILDFLVELSNFNEVLNKKVKEVSGEKRFEEIKEEIEEKIEEESEQEKLLVIEKTEEKEIKETSIELIETHVKVDVKLLDQLMNLAGELVLARNRVVQLAQRIIDEDLSRSVQALSMITTEIQETIMKTRMQPIGTVFNKFPRIVRDLAKSLGKKVNLHLEGTETELDRSIIEAIKDPLTHLVRNAIDHGIEPPEVRVQIGKPQEGTLILRAYQEGGQVVIEVEDDGKGIDVEKIRQKAIEKSLLSYEEAISSSEKELLSLIFKPGFSTAENVTQISGRGVGMDVVKANIEKLGGSIELNTIYGKGTTIKIKIPLTLAIIPALIVTSGEYRYAIPQINLKELIIIQPERELLKIGNTEFYRLRGEVIPVLRLSEILKTNGKKENQKNLVILTTGEKFVGLLVDKIFASEEIVVKPLGKWFKNIPIYSGATIMGDGKLALILDVVGLSQFVGISVEEVEKKYEAATKIKISTEESYFILLFDIGKERMALPIALISRLDKVKANKIQISGGKEVIVYKNEVVPIIRLENYLPIEKIPPQEEYIILFFTEKDKTCGILCSQIVDTIEITLNVEEGIYNYPGILGHKIIEGKTVLFIDIYKIIEMYDPEWFGIKKKEEIKKKKILLVEDSTFFRNMIKNYLQTEGYEVETVQNGKEALEKLAINKYFDLIITDLQMPEMDGFEFIKIVKSTPDYEKIPIIAITPLAEEETRKKVLELGANGYEVKLDREKLITQIENLGG